MKKWWFVILFSCFSLILFGAEPKWEAVKSIRASFKQEIKGERGAVPVVYSGKFYAANNKVKWDYLSPLEKEVYAEGNTVFVYEHKLAQITRGSLEENLDFIQILKKLKKNSSGHYEATISGVKYMLEADGNKPQRLFYKDNLDNQITLQFSDVELNVEIDPAVFTINPPPGVEYIDL